MNLSYIVYRKEQSKIRRKRREKIGREYDQISEIIKKKYYLQIHLNCQLQEVSNVNNMMNLHRLTSFITFNIDRVIPKPCGMNLACILQLSTFIRLRYILSETKNPPEKLS